MALMTRLSRLLRADLHALLDRFEEPDILLAQALRDMEDAIADDERNLTLLRRRRAGLQARRDALLGKAEADTGQLEVCLDAARDDLARELLRRDLERERLSTLLQRDSADLDGRIETLAARLTEHRHRLEQLRAEAALLSRPEPGDPGQDRPISTEYDIDGLAPVCAAEVEAALLAAKQRRSA